MRQHRPQGPEAAPPLPIQEEETRLDTSNAARAASLGLGGGGGGDDAPPPGDGDLPHRGRLESALGLSLADLPVHLDAQRALATSGASAAATADGIFLGDDTSLEVVAEEVVHWLQLQGGGGGGAVSDPSDPEEWEAREIAGQIARGEQPDPVTLRARARIMRHDDGLTDTQRDQLRGFAEQASVALYAELGATWTQDSQVIGALAQYFGAVRGISGEAWFVDQARRMLKRCYWNHCHLDLVTHIRQGLEGDDEARAVQWVTVRGTPVPRSAQDASGGGSSEGGGRGAGGSEGGATESGGTEGEATEAASGDEGGATAPTTGLTDAERETVRGYADAAITALRAELRATFVTEDANVLAALRRFHSQLQGLLDRATPPARGEALTAKRSESLRILRHRYGNQTNHSLKTDIESGLQFDAEAEALRLIGVQSGGQDDASPTEATPADPAAAARLAAWPHCQRLQREVQELTNATFTSIDVGDIDSAYDAALEAAVGAGASRDQAHTIVRNTYREIAGTSLAQHLAVAAHGDAAIVADLPRRLGITLPTLPAVGEDQDEGTGTTGSSEGASSDTGWILQALNSEFREGITEDEEVLRLCRQLAAATRAAAGERDAAGIDAWNARRAAALEAAVADYGRRFGTGLGTEIRGHVSDESIQRTCLTLVGDRGSTTTHVVAEAAHGAAEGEDAAASTARVDAVEELSEALRTIADALADALDDTFVDGGEVRRQCNAFYQTWQRFRGDERFGDQLQTPAYARSILLQHYPGNLVEDIRTEVSEQADKDAAFRSLGLGYTALAESLDARGEAGTADVGSMDATGRATVIIEERVRTLFSTVSMHDRNRSEGGWINPEAIGRDYQAAIRAGTAHGLSAEEAAAQVAAAYERVNHIALLTHLGYACEGIEGRARQLSEATGLRVAALQRVGAGDQGALDESVTIEGDATRQRVGEDGEYAAFSREDAWRLARQLYQAIEDQDRAEVSSILAHDRPAEERRAITAMFEATYHVSLDYMLASNFDNQGDDWEIVHGAAADGAMTLHAELERLARSESDAVYRRVMQLSAEERSGVLANSRLMGLFREAYGEDGYERIRETLLGNLGIDDMMRTRDTETLGMGTDEEGFEADLTEFVRMRRRELAPAVVAEARERHLTGDAARTWVAAEVRRRVEADLVRRSASPDAIAAAFSEVGGEDYLQAFMRLDTADGSLDHRQAAIADPTAAGVLDHLRELSDRERAQLLADRDFMDRLRGNTPLVYNQAVLILRGQGGLADVEVGLDGTDTDETQVFRGLTEGDADQMYAQSQNRVLRERVAGELDGDDTDAADEDSFSERALYDRMMTDFEGLGPAPERSADDTDGSQYQAARRERFLNELHVRHKYRIFAGLQDGNDALLRAATAIYNERGTFTPDPAHADATEDLFDDAQRRRLLEAVEPRLRSELHIRASSGGTTANDALFAAVRGGILHEADPSTFRLTRALSGFTNEEAAQRTLDEASEQTIAEQWSNICSRGIEGGQFSEVVRPWIAGGRLETGEDFRRMVDFRLDVSARLNRQISDDWAMGDRERLDYLNQVRRRILALPWERVKAALAVAGVQVQDTDQERIFGADRATRSRYTHDLDEFDQQRGQGSVADIWSSTDEDVDASALQYSGELEHALEDDDVLSEAERERIAQRESDFESAVREYREAKQAAAEVTKGIAIAIIGAIATAVSGPGGPTLVAALVTASAQAAVTTAIDEAMQGRDFEAVTEGLQRLATEVATAGVTHGMGTMMSAAAERLPRVGDLVARAGAMRQALRQARERSRVALLQHALVEGAISSSGQVVQNFGAEVMEILDPAMWEDGWNSGTSNASRRLGTQIDQWPRDFVKEFVKSSITTYTAEEIDRLFTRGRTVGSLGPRRLGSDASRELTGRFAGQAGESAADLVSGEQMDWLDRDFWQADQVTDFGRGLAGRTAGRVLDDQAEAARDERIARITTAHTRRAEVSGALDAVDLPEGMSREQLDALYRRHLTDDGLPDHAELTPTPGESPDALAQRQRTADQRAAREHVQAFEQTQLRRIRAGLDRNLRGRTLRDDERQAYLSWVMGQRNGSIDPSGAEGRLEQGWDGYQAWRATQVAAGPQP